MVSRIRVLGVEIAGVSGTVAARLTEDGFDVVPASSGLDAVKRLDDAEFDCVVIGDGVGTNETLALVRDVDPAIPVVAVADAVEAVPGSGRVEFTAPDDLAGAIHRAVAGRRADAVRRTHGRLKNAFRSVAAATLDRPSRPDLERGLYERLAETGCYQFVWIGDYDGTSGEFESRVPVEGRFAGPALDALVEVGDGNLLDRAVETGRVAVTRGDLETRSTAAASTAPSDRSVADGRASSLRVAAVPFQHEGEVVGTMLLSTDRESAFDEAEKELLGDLGAIVANRIRTMDGSPGAQDAEDRRFAELLAHEVRSPLGIASSQLELAKETGDDENLDRVRAALSRIEETVVAILDVTRAKGTLGGEPPVDLDELAEAAWEAVDPTGADLRVESSGRIRGHRDLLVRLFSNLFRNAIEHGDDAVTVRVGLLDDGFFVADDGVGIDPDARDRVFEWGYSTTTDGIGIGLGFVDAIVEAHGWAIEVTESAWGGARFEVTGVSFDADEG